MSVRYLLDTNVISDFVRGERRVLASMKGTRPDVLAVSTVTVMEIEYGLALQSGRARRLRSLLEALIGSISVLPFTSADASAAATARAGLRRSGRPIGPYDVLLAGCALSRGLVLVTANTGEFERVDGLITENWRALNA
jgi:tRNA(fMet)-specific endonuclease VapC